MAIIQTSVFLVSLATQRKKQEANLSFAERVAEADAELKAMFGDPLPTRLEFGHPMYGTIEWLQFQGQKGHLDLLKVIFDLSSNLKWIVAGKSAL